MEYITTQQAAKVWGISDRRVRILCAEGKIPGVVKAGKTYKIPANAEKPADGRVKNESKKFERYLKWNDDIIGVVDSANAVDFTAASYNEVVALYTRGAAAWTPEQFGEFLSERVVSRDRRKAIISSGTAFIRKTTESISSVSTLL